MSPTRLPVPPLQRGIQQINTDAGFPQAGVTRERVRSGPAAARARGKRIGQPKRDVDGSADYGCFFVLAFAVSSLVPFLATTGLARQKSGAAAMISSAGLLNSGM